MALSNRLSLPWLHKLTSTDMLHPPTCRASGLGCACKSSGRRLQPPVPNCSSNRPHHVHNPSQHHRTRGGTSSCPVEPHLHPAVRPVRGLQGRECDSAWHSCRARRGSKSVQHRVVSALYWDTQHSLNARVVGGDDVVVSSQRRSFEQRVTGAAMLACLTRQLVWLPMLPGGALPAAS